MAVRLHAVIRVKKRSQRSEGTHLLKSNSDKRQKITRLNAQGDNKIDCNSPRTKLRSSKAAETDPMNLNLFSDARHL